MLGTGPPCRPSSVSRGEILTDMNWAGCAVLPTVREPHSVCKWAVQTYGPTTRLIGPVDADGRVRGTLRSIRRAPAGIQSYAQHVCDAGTQLGSRGPALTVTMVTPITEGTRVFDIPRLDGAWNGAVGQSDEVPEEVIVDLGEASYIAHECLPFMLGLIEHRVIAGLSTLINLPKKESTVDFLRAWGFPEAVKCITGRSLESFLTPASAQRYAIQILQPPKYSDVRTDPSGGRETVLPVTYFALTPISLSDDAETSASLVKAKWLEEHLLSVLGLHLGAHSDRVATHILYEGVLNAATHPNATVAYTSGQIALRNRIPSELAVTIWDNGDSFASTLKACIDSGRRIVSSAHGLMDERFDVHFADRPGEEPRRFQMNSKDLLNAKSEEELLLSAFFLGVTSAIELDVWDQTKADHLLYVPDVLLPDHARGYPGIGLHLIRKTVLDLFGGQLHYYSGGHRLLLESTRDPGSYVARLTKLRPSDPQISGNLLVAKLPLV